jgi:hypothetical protein
MRALLIAALLSASSPARAQIVMDGEVPNDDSRFMMLPFTVPAGTVEIEVAHDDMSEANILDWGLYDPSGFRGWGGGNTEPAIVGTAAASRSYLPGPIEAGEWFVLIGKAKIEEMPARYHVEITLRTEATLAPMPERRPYAHAPALETNERWYAGDFHVHSRESGDAHPSLDEIGTFARSRGLDFVLLSEHNTTSHVELIGDAQERHPELLFVPGVEFTTYSGHANGIGAIEHVDWKVGEPGVTIAGAIEGFHAQDALFSINHPALDLGNICIGCAWDHDVDPATIDAVEIETGGYTRVGFAFFPLVIPFWDDLLDRGGRAAAIGGSDDHRAGTGTGMFDSPIGSPATMVLATELSVPAIVEAVRQGRTVVKLDGPENPMIDLTAGDARIGDTIDAPRFTLAVHATGAATGDVIRFVRNGEIAHMVEVTGDPFDATFEAEAPYGETGDRWRAELWTRITPRTITSHIFVAAQPGSPPAPDTGCACRSTSTSAVSILAIPLLLALRRRR